jgi:hypothetical protein
VEDERRHVVGQRAVVLPDLAQRVPDHDVAEQGKRGAGAVAVLEQRAQQPRVVEQRVEPAVHERPLGGLALPGIVAGDESDGELRITSIEPAANVGEDHPRPPAVAVSECV